MLAPVSEPWWRPFRATEGAFVAIVDLAEDSTREAAAYAWLDDRERERCERFAYAAARRQFLLCRAALRVILCGELDCQNRDLAFPIGEHRRPFATVEGEPAPISFSVSHSGKYGLVAYARKGRLGVDIEELSPRRNLEPLMEGAFGPEERREVLAAEGAEQLRRFFRIWTMKEALLKAHGKGFLLDATAFEVPAALRRGASTGEVELPQLPGVTFRVEDLGGAHFAAALAHDLERGSSPE